jgi:hypothetical protein
MAVLLGRNVFIYNGSSGTSPIIAAAKSCTVSKKCETVEKASSTSATDKEFRAGRSEWEVSLSHLVTTGAPFDGLLKVRGTYTLSVVIGNTRKTGQAICVAADLGAPVDGLAKGNVKFQGTGPLT